MSIDPYAANPEDDAPTPEVITHVITPEPKRKETYAELVRRIAESR